VYTGGNVRTLVIMYSINVFVTFLLSMLGICRHWWLHRNRNPVWRRRLALSLVGATLCVVILGVTVYEKFGEELVFQKDMVSTAATQRDRLLLAAPLALRRAADHDSPHARAVMLILGDRCAFA
jgi:uncharacterized membrane protein